MRVRRSTALTAALAILFAPGLSAAQSPHLIPPGTRATLALKGWLSSEDADVGDTFEAWLVSDISVEGQLVVPAGAIFVGRVAAVESAKSRSRGGELTLIFDKLVSGDGRSAAAPATVSGLVEGTQTEGKNNTAKNAGIGGAIGGVLGAIVGGSTGLLIGLAVGAGGGMVAGRGKEVTLPEGTQLLVKFDQQVEVTWDWAPVEQH